jgi:hypothetical protein
MSRKKTNQPEYGTELKLAAVHRVLAGESVSAIARLLWGRSPLYSAGLPKKPPIPIGSQLQARENRSLIPPLGASSLTLRERASLHFRRPIGRKNVCGIKVLL